MNLNETKLILKDVALLDNRKLDEAVAMAWHSVIGLIPYDIAKEALKLAQQDATIKYLEPRHIVGWAREAAFRLDRQKKKEPEQFKGDEQPICKQHGAKILSCDPCCDRLYRYSEQFTDKGLLAWAKENIYA